MKRKTNDEKVPCDMYAGMQHQVIQVDKNPAQPINVSISHINVTAPNWGEE